MNTNCLVTKLKGVVDNNNLPYLNAFKVDVLPSQDGYVDQDYTIKVYGTTRIKVVGKGTVYVGVTNPVAVTSASDYMVPAGAEKCTIKAAPGSYSFICFNKGDIYSLGTMSNAGSSSQRGLKVDLSQLDYSPLKDFVLAANCLTGTLKMKNGSTFTSILAVLNTDYSSIRDYCIDIDGFVGANIASIDIRNSKSKGDINSLASSTAITNITIPMTNIYGDVKTFIEAQVASGKRANNTSIKLNFFQTHLTYGDHPLSTAADAQELFGFEALAINIIFDSTAENGYRITQ